MKRALLFVVVFALGVAGYVGYTRLAGSEPTPQLVTAQVSRGDVVQVIDATGRLEAVTTVQVGSQVSGTIQALYADFNSQVRRGQVVARLEPSLFETQVEQARATVVRLQADVRRAQVQYEDAQLKLARARDLASRQLIPATDLETAEVNAKATEAALEAARAQVVQAEASLNQSQVNLSHTVITAPIDGVVISRNVDVGQTVAASMSAPTLFEIANDMSRMRVNANIEESDIGVIREGQPVTFQVDAFPDETFSGTVSQVRLDPVIESNVVSYVTVIDVPNPDQRLRPGMTATVTVEVARAVDTLRIPASALRFSPTPEVLDALGQPLRDDATGSPATAPGSESVAGRSGAPDAGRAASFAQLQRMTPEERQAFFAARGRGPAGAQAARLAAGGAATGMGRVWTVVDGRLQPLTVRIGTSDGANVAIEGGGLQEGVVVATGMLETSTPAATPVAGSPLLPQFGRGGRGAGGGQASRGRGGQ